MISNVSSSLEKVFNRWMPDTFVYTIVLTLLTLIASSTLTASTPAEILHFWGNGIWSLLSFSMQIALVLVTGHAVASSNAASKFFSSVATLTKSSRKAIALVTIVSLFSNWLNPGFGLVASAIFAVAVGKRLPNANYALLVAAAYSGYVIWHAGISGTIPLQIASPGEGTLGTLVSEPISVTKTIFSPSNIILCLILLFTLPLLNMLMDDPNHRNYLVTAHQLKTPDGLEDLATLPTEKSEALTPAERIENSRLLGFAIAGLGFSYIVVHFKSGGGFSLNMNNLILMTAGIVLHGSPKRYVVALSDASKVISGVILQYPFYGGIMEVMKGSELTVVISNWFVSISSQDTYLIFTFLSAGLLNFFVPSGGGQWALQAQIVSESAAQLEIPLSHAAMAVAYGDTWTNLIQPFWALPILAVSGLSIKHIMSYCFIAFAWTGIVFLSVLVFLY